MFEKIDFIAHAIGYIVLAMGVILGAFVLGMLIMDIVVKFSRADEKELRDMHNVIMRKQFQIDATAEGHCEQ